MQQRRKEGINIVTKIPPGYITKVMFAEKAECAKQNVSKMRREGKIAKANMRWLAKPGVTGFELLIHEEKELYPYLRSKAEDKQPKWFVKQEKGEDWSEEESGEENTSYEEMPKAYWDGRKAKVDTEKRELELQKAKNEVIPVEDVTSLLADIAMAIKQGMASAIPRSVPELAAAKTEHSCTQILNKEFNQVLDSLTKIDDYIETISH